MTRRDGSKTYKDFYQHRKNTLYLGNDVLSFKMYSIMQWLLRTLFELL